MLKLNNGTSVSHLLQFLKHFRVAIFILDGETLKLIDSKMSVHFADDKDVVMKWCLNRPQQNKIEHH